MDGGFDGEIEVGEGNKRGEWRLDNPPEEIQRDKRQDDDDEDGDDGHWVPSLPISVSGPPCAKFLVRPPALPARHDF